MPRRLSKIRWSEDLHDAVQFFDFGEQFWEREIAEWIKDEANEEERTRPGNEVWLYISDDGQLVGYACLGPSRWLWPEASSPPIEINIIAAVGIHREYWGEPRGDGETRYSDQIMQDIIAEALKYTERNYLLGLYVHPNNVRALRVYERWNFRELKHRRRRFHADQPKYLGLILELTEETED